jgi:hypothetical protein
MKFQQVLTNFLRYFSLTPVLAGFEVGFMVAAP